MPHPIEPEPLLVRPLEPSDPLSDLTALLHAAYGRLARMGLRYMATHQSEAITRERVESGTCLVAVADERIIGTILFRGPEQTNGCSWYDRPEVASLGQFAVDPEIQARGIGLRLLCEVERLARASGAQELALDTAEPATHLVSWYTRLGYRFIEHAQWSHTNYRSVILSKELRGGRIAKVLKFVHLSDLHLVPPGHELHGLRPDERLTACVSHITHEHSDAAFCVVSGDLTHDGDALAYAEAARILSHLPMPVHLMIGNHDDRDAFRAAFPAALCDRYAFVQQVVETPAGQLILLDTHEPGRAEGRLCERRVEWLNEVIAASSGPIFLFMHHPPFAVGFDRMDSIRLLDADALAAVMAPARGRVRHLFVGHLHRNVAGSWRGWPFSGVRGTSHQIALDFTTRGFAPVSFEAPGYAVVRIENESVVVHFAEVGV